VDTPRLSPRTKRTGLPGRIKSSCKSFALPFERPLAACPPCPPTNRLHCTGLRSWSLNAASPPPPPPSPPLRPLSQPPKRALRSQESDPIPLGEEHVTVPYKVRAAPAPLDRTTRAVCGMRRTPAPSRLLGTGRMPGSLGAPTREAPACYRVNRAPPVNALNCNASFSPHHTPMSTRLTFGSPGVWDEPRRRGHAARRDQPRAVLGAPGDGCAIHPPAHDAPMVPLSPAPSHIPVPWRSGLVTSLSPPSPHPFAIPSRASRALQSVVM